MFVIPCPWCGPREQAEFHCCGEAHIARPADADDAAWAGYLYLRDNLKGLHAERWLHAHGCRRWFHLLRHTGLNRIVAVYRIGETPPSVDWSDVAPPSDGAAPR